MRRFLTIIANVSFQRRSGNDPVTKRANQVAIATLSPQSSLAFVSLLGVIIFLALFLSRYLSSPIFRKTDTVRHGEFTGLFVES